MAPWEKIFKFVGDDGETYWSAVSLDTSKVELGSTVTAFSTIEALENSQGVKQVGVKKILAPIPGSKPIIYGIGGNYRAHVKEVGVPIPTHPALIFIKPYTSLADPDTAIQIGKHAYENFWDYEGELAFVTSKDALNVSKEDAHEYILGYTIGQDMTARKWHEDGPSGGQVCYSKSFDNCSPIGPFLVREDVFANAPTQTLKTFVNGTKQQASPLDDLIYGPTQCLSFLSQGHTVPAGSVYLTGTPGGVGLFRKPPYDLKDGDEIRVEIPIIGTLTNTIKYVK